MFRSMLQAQWKVARWPVLLLVPPCALLPILMVRLAARLAAAVPFPDPARDTIRVLHIWVPLFPLLAIATGAAIALAAWQLDHKTDHVYALSLPLARWEYVLLKMSSASVILALPVVATFAGAFIAVHSVSIPEGLHAYPVAFGARFLLASLSCFAVIFALGAGTVKTTVYIFVFIILGLIAGDLLVDFVASALSLSHVSTPFDWISATLFDWGPFSVFGGSWLLIDV
jgi:hypothetical protein